MQPAKSASLSRQAAGKWRQQSDCRASHGVAPVQEDHSVQTQELKAGKSHTDCTPLVIAYSSLKKMDIIKQCIPSPGEVELQVGTTVLAISSFQGV